MKRTPKGRLALDLPWEYLVVGEHRSDPLRILLLGADGHYYEFRLRGGETIPVEPDEEWIIEAVHHGGLASKVA